jgi:hypothetical protein
MNHEIMNKEIKNKEIMNKEIKNKENKFNENKFNDSDNDISETQKIERYIEREDMYLDLTYSDDILNVYMNIDEYVKGCNILEKLSLDDLTGFIKNYSSLYEIYYESDEEDEIDSLIEYDY